MMHAAIGWLHILHFIIEDFFSFSLMKKDCSSHTPDLLDFSRQHLKREIALGTGLKSGDILQD